MESIKFDFNNMFKINIGSAHGVEDKDISEISADIERGHEHLSKAASDLHSRIKLSLEWMILPYQDVKTIRDIQRLGNEIAKKYDNVISLGIGGSYLGLKAAQDALAARIGVLEVRATVTIEGYGRFQIECDLGKCPYPQEGVFDGSHRSFFGDVCFLRGRILTIV